MPFKQLGIEKIVLLISSVFVLYLGFSGRLGLYIHPRYIYFTVVFSLMCLVVLLVAANVELHAKEHEGWKLSLIPLVIILGAAVLLPARSLSSATVSQRSIDSGSIVTSVGGELASVSFAGSSRGLKLSDWSRLLDANSNPDYYINKPVKISGFIYNADLGADTILLARFVLTCCAVDAQPVGVPVRLEGWQEQYQEDSWLKIEGEFKLNEVVDKSELVLIPTSVESIEQPRNPYAN